MEYICAQPTDEYFVWQVALWAQSLQDIGESSHAHVLLYNPKDRAVSKKWGSLARMFPEVSFKIYENTQIDSAFKMYSPCIVPFLLYEYFNEHPELEEKVIYQCDSDIIFLKPLEINHLLEDEVCYLSDTNNYISSTYLYNKASDVLENKKEAYKKIDVVKELARLAQVPLSTVIENKDHSGGAQYLLKNVKKEMWKKIFGDSITIKLYLDGINRRYFPKEKYIQAWTAGMWSYLYNLWYYGKTTRVVKEMDFQWPINLINSSLPILHNAGVTDSSTIRTTQKDENGNNVQVNAPAFFKGKYSNGKNPYEDVTELEKIVTHPVSQKYGTAIYTAYLLKYKDKFQTIYNN
jgi:hypothetical protein